MKFPSWPNPKDSREINFGLDRVYDLLARVGNPHLKLPPTIHIAGTNGKGSTLAFLRSIFAEAGLKIHTYTSPHLVNFNERITLSGAEISDEFLNEVLDECKKAAERSPEIPVTFFEATTVAAFLAFSRVKADLLLLEVGMGGRLDATNVLPEVLCSIITPIAFDHEDFLGKTLEKIAFEKAGIIKKNCPVIIGKQKPSALKAIKTQANKMNSESLAIFEKEGGKLRSNWTGDLSISLLGDHQQDNAALAIATALTQKKFPITEKQIEDGLKKTIWPARLQKISSGKFFKILPDNFELYLDGSHNMQGAATVAKFLKERKKHSSSLMHKRLGSHDLSSKDLQLCESRMTKTFIIFSMLNDKNCEGFLKKIAKETDQLIAITIPDEPKSRTASEINEVAKKIGINSIAAKGFDEAFEIIKTEKGPALALVCGSLYLAGNFLGNS